ncbi:glycerophosphodiester phosphodiesterase [Virgibacillus dokdonensis]|uniref:Glycerophosphoryl diester phosphodiesterase n=2 Tax=Virgibacillus TaxID=84406 RepID=A0A1M5LMV5_9BACI|nr:MULTISPECIES: glycerophosphodiester phosphodiesterase [Virgibacillus]RFA37181.1 glycerophosphodiester phosphodiesterase [Virgibacillus dokdonensis]SHG66391.1 glycerophosphoryl diester phosphodiesterase [Virgibacillus chiguensis]
MKPTLYAHRGASYYAPENTMPAFELAYQMQADGIETDVQLTKDQVPVLIHDENVKRTTNSSGYIKDYTYHELCQLDAGSWFSPNYAHTPIPTLEDFLTWAKHKPLYLNIELKNNKVAYHHIEAIVYEYISAYQLTNRTTISTFNPNSVVKLLNYRKNIEIALLTSRRYRYPIHVAKELGASALHLKYKLITPKIVASAYEQNVKLRLYTVNRPAHIIRSIQYGVDGMFTDVPDLAFYYRNLLYNR